MGVLWTRCAYEEGQFLLLNGPPSFSKDLLTPEGIQNRCLGPPLLGFLLLSPLFFPHQLGWSPWKRKRRELSRDRQHVFPLCTSTWCIFLVFLFFPPSFSSFFLTLFLPSWYIFIRFQRVVIKSNYMYHLGYVLIYWIGKYMLLK